jgi:hypothetical protein
VITLRLPRGVDTIKRDGLTVFLFTKDAKEKYPGQFQHILQRPGAIAAPHIVTNGFDHAVERLLRGVALAVGFLRGYFASHKIPCFRFWRAFAPHWTKPISVDSIGPI